MYGLPSGAKLSTIYKLYSRNTYLVIYTIVTHLLTLVVKRIIP